MVSSFEVVADLLGRARLRAIDEHLHAAPLGLDHDGLLPEPPHHVEGTFRLPAQGELEDVLLDAFLDHLPEFFGDAEEAVGGAEALERLVGPAVVVVLHPEPHPLAGGLEALELGADQKLLPDRLPEALDLAQGHGMVGAALQVVHVVLPELGLEAGGPPPAGELPALVGEELLGEAVLGHRPAVDLEDVLCRLAAEDLEPHHVAGVVVEEANEIGVLAAELEGEDVGLPELVRGRPLEGAGRGRVARRLGFLLPEQVLRMQRAAHRLPAHGQEQDPPEELADPLDPEVGVAALEGDDLLLHRGRHLRARGPLGQLSPQARLPLRPVGPQPKGDRAGPHAELTGHLLDGEALLQAELHRLAPDLKRVWVNVRLTRPALCLPMSPLLLPVNLSVPCHGSHSFRVLLGTPASECHPFSPPVFAHDLVVSSGGGSYGKSRHYIWARGPQPLLADGVQHSRPRSRREGSA
ncbi:MAG TPA: hypothetical protein VFF02_20275 [Anaeromyxobacteraceae bacterium]|nr:hypothetical protein [Anaeromyxobacteraceae bacterium]